MRAFTAQITVLARDDDNEQALPLCRTVTLTMLVEPPKPTAVSNQDRPNGDEDHRCWCRHGVQHVGSSVRHNPNYEARDSDHSSDRSNLV